MMQDESSKIMKYLPGALSALAAIFLALVLVPYGTLVSDNKRMYGVGAFVGTLLAALFSPLLWGIALLVFALFLATSQLRAKCLRIVLFWFPAITISTLGLTLLILLARSLILFYSMPR